MVVIAWIIKWFLNKSNWVKNKISHSFKEKIKSKQIKKDLKENKETIINPNTEDTKTDEEFKSAVNAMKAQAKGFGYQECWDWTNEQAKLRKAAEDKASN